MIELTDDPDHPTIWTNLILVLIAAPGAGAVIVLRLESGTAFIAGAAVYLIVNVAVSRLFGSGPEDRRRALMSFKTTAFVRFALIFLALWSVTSIASVVFLPPFGEYLAAQVILAGMDPLIKRYTDRANRELDESDDTAEVNV